MTIIDLWNEIYFHRLAVDSPSRAQSTAPLVSEWETFLAFHGLVDRSAFGSSQNLLDGKNHPRELAEPDCAAAIELFVTRVEQTLRERCVEPPASFWRLSALLALSIADLWEDCVSNFDLAAQGVDTEAIPPGYPLFSESSALRQHLQQAEDTATSAGDKLPDSVYRLAAVSALSVARRAEAWWSQLAQPRYDSNSGGDTDKAMEVSGRNPSSPAGEYFGANIWAWGAIHHLIIQLCNDLLDAETLEGIDWNEGYGPADQETCTNMASRFELWMEHNVNGLSVELGWVSDVYGRLYKEEQVMPIPGLGMRPAHRVSDEFLKQWIEFLRHCGGFEVW